MSRTRRRRRNSIHRWIAFRHLTSRSNRGFLSFITIIAMAGVTLGVAALIITLSILNGFETTIHRNVVAFTAHLQLFAFQNQLLPEPERTIRTVMERYPEVSAMAPYVTREGMARSDQDVDGIQIKGVDPSNDISAARNRLVDGEYDLAERDSGLQSVIIGKRLAEKLQAEVGDRILLYALGGSSISIGQTRILQVIVRGIYETGMADYDGSVVYIDLRNAQRLFQIGRTVSGFDILVNDLGKLDQLSREVPEQLGYPYYARTMYQQYRNLFTWIQLQKKPIPVILGLIIIVATVNIVGTLLMMVMEKAREVGTLRTLGMSRKMIVRIFQWKGMIIGIVGTLLGNAIAYALCWIELTYRLFPLPSGVYFMTHVPIQMSVWDFALVSGLSLVMCYAASVFPARVAASLDPLRTLRFS